MVMERATELQLLESHPQLVLGTKRKGRAGNLDGTVVDGVDLEPADNLSNEDLHLDEREVHADALPGTVVERLKGEAGDAWEGPRLGPAVGLELGGVGTPDGRVHVDDGRRQLDHGRLGNPDARDPHGPVRLAGSHGHGAVQSEDLLDEVLEVLALFDAGAGVVQVAEVSAEALLDILVLGELMDSPGDGASCGIMACSRQISICESQA